MFLFLRFLSSMQDEEGQTLVEYALLLALIAIVTIGILIVLGEQVNNTFSEVTSAIQGS